MAAKKTPPMQMETQDQSIKSTSYRLERLGTFSWQAYQIIFYANGTITEGKIFKDDVLDLVLQKINRAMKEEGNAQFMEKKNTLNA